MTDDFLSQGLQNDRYLKALRLVEQFEDEIGALLFDFEQRMVDQQPDLFDSSTDPGIRSNHTPSNGLAFQRINHTMNGPLAPTDGQTLRLNVHLYWMPPTEYDRTDIGSALRGFGYKIKGADTEIDDHVVEQTESQGWSIATAGNPYDSNTVFYRHVSTKNEIQETADTLVEHFSEFGDEYSIEESY